MQGEQLTSGLALHRRAWFPDPVITIRLISRLGAARRFAAIVVVATAVVAINSQPAALSPMAARAATGPTITVSPATNLINQSVKVRWSEFINPTQFGANYVAVYQCKANPTSISTDCYTANAFPSSEGGNRILTGVTGSDLTGSVNFEVRNSAQLPELGCDDKTPCSIVAFDANNSIPANALPDNAVVAPISFARTNTSCPLPLEFDAVIGGEASAAQQMYQWAAARCLGSDKLSVDFTESNSINAREDLLSGLVDIAITSLPATPTESSAGKNTASIKYAPINLNAAVFAFNINDARTRQPITDMTLSPRLVTRLVTDSQLLGFFQDPEFLALNPGHNWPDGGASQPILRAERNADTYITTDWMFQDANAKLLLKGQDIHRVRLTSDFLNKVYPVENFEATQSDPGFIPQTGELKGARSVFYQARPDGQQFATQGYIGLMSRSNAIRFGLSMSKLTNKSGNAVAPDQAGLLAGLAAMRNVNGVLVPDPTVSAAAAYPLTKIDYAMVRTSIVTDNSAATKTGDSKKAASLKDFLGYAVGAGRTNLALGYLQLPDSLASQASGVINSIASLGGGTNTTTTSQPRSTTTTAGTSTTVTNATTPTTFFSGGGLDNGGACCGSASSQTTFSSTTPTSVGTTPTTRPATTSEPRYALTAPNWVPISNIGPAGSGKALPILLGFGALAAATTCLWPLLERLGRLRTRVLKAAGVA